MTSRRLHRVGLSSTVLMTIALAVAPAAAASGPDHSKGGPSTLDLPAGVVCAFEVRWDIDGTTDNQLVFPARPNGDQLVRIDGRELLTITNVDSGALILLRGGYREDLLFHADGSIDVDITGTIVAGYFPTDLGGPSMWWFKGHLHDGADSTFTVLDHSFSGKATNLCAALS